jgi:hypothetical protein
MMPPAVLESLLRVRRLQHDIQNQFLLTFYIFCDLKDAMTELEETQILAEQQGASVEYLARLHSILHLLKGLEASVITLLDFLSEVSSEIERSKEHGSMT